MAGTLNCERERERERESEPERASQRESQRERERERERESEREREVFGVQGLGLLLSPLSNAKKLLHAADAAMSNLGGLRC
jgi:hypothetical protein